MAGTEVQKAGGPPKDQSETLATITRDILDETFYNIIHDIVAKVHREEKVARATSAVIGVRQLAEKESAPPSDDGAENQQTAAAVNGSLNSIKVETGAAVYDGGRVYLKGNPLVTTKEILCPNCHLPRLLYPLFGEGARPPPDPNKEYCRKHPPIRMPGRDVHGNPFAIEKATNKKKKTQGPDGSTPTSSPPSNVESAPAPSSLKQLPDKMFMPTTKCPNCPRYFLVTKSAQHLDRCLGITTRQSSRNRTPFDSGISTPAASAPTARKRARPDEEELAPAKKRKDISMQVKFKTGKPAVPSKLKNGTTLDMVSPGSPPAANLSKPIAKTKLNKPSKDRDPK
ncbi:transcriptional activator [Coccidioides immitis RS]|uniref:SAGA-associated factor 11 n=1 Tax=Coccidioides immitis (strain RS) TaxID=246410 RepID=J3K6V0_COCIM|nr:transcriptional activator [Coccidioides immitis RS]EAS30340.3 transcriptional activator [Coccidioides immitis RS]